MPVSVPLDDVARKVAMKGLKETLEKKGPVAAKNFLRNKFGSAADNVVKLIDDVIASSITQSTSKWGKGSYDSVKDLIIDHFYRHGKEVGADDVAQYMRKAEDFYRTIKGARAYKVGGYVEGAVKYVKNGKYIIVDPATKTILSFGKVVN